MPLIIVPQPFCLIYYTLSVALPILDTLFVCCCYVSVHMYRARVYEYVSTSTPIPIPLPVWGGQRVTFRHQFSPGC